MSNITQREFQIFKTLIDTQITTITQQLALIATRIDNSISENTVIDKINIIREDVNSRISVLAKQLNSIRQDIGKL